MPLLRAKEIAHPIGKAPIHVALCDHRLAGMRTNDEARTPRRLLALLIAMSGMSSLSLNILVPAIPGLVTKFAADPANVQLAVSLYLMGLAAAQLVFGPLSDRFGRRPVVLAGLALAAFASTAAVFSANIASLVTARVAQSLGVVPYSVRHESESAPRRNPLPGSDRQSVSRLHRDDDGRLGWRAEQDASG